MRSLEISTMHKQGMVGKFNTEPDVDRQNHRENLKLAMIFKQQGIDVLQ